MANTEKRVQVRAKELWEEAGKPSSGPQAYMDRARELSATHSEKTGARAIDEAQLAAEVAHEGAADRTLVPRRQPRSLHGLPIRRGVLLDEVPDERRLPLLAAPHGRPLASATLLDGGSGGRTGP